MLEGEIGPLRERVAEAEREAASLRLKLEEHGIELTNTQAHADALQAANRDAADKLEGVRGEMASKMRTSAVQQLQSVMIRLVRGEAGLAIHSWKSSVVQHREQLIRSRSKGSAIKQLKAAMIRLVKGELGVALHWWHNGLVQAERAASANLADQLELSLKMSDARGTRLEMLLKEREGELKEMTESKSDLKTQFSLLESSMLEVEHEAATHKAEAATWKQHATAGEGEIKRLKQELEETFNDGKASLHNAAMRKLQFCLAKQIKGELYAYMLSWAQNVQEDARSQRFGGCFVYNALVLS